MPRDGVVPISNTSEMFRLICVYSFRWSRGRGNIDVEDWPDSRNKTELLNRLKKYFLLDEKHGGCTQIKNINLKFKS